MSTTENKVDETKAENFPELKNDLLLRAARGEPTEKVPVWLHRQAGRYLPEFREERLKADFFTICRSPELACKVTLQPLDRYELDCAIIFSDILVVPQALGLHVDMVKGKGPVLPEPLVDPSHLKRLKTFEEVKVAESLGYVMDAITLTRHRLQGRVPLIGFSGAPFTLMAYMIEGQGAKTWSKTKAWLYTYPEESHKLFQLVTDVVVEYLILQALAGAQLLEVFDSWAGDLPPHMFEEFALPYLVQICKRVKEGVKARGGEDNIPMTIFPRGAHYALELLKDSGYDVVSLDWTIRPPSARKQLGDKITCQGNLDSSAMFASDERLCKEIQQMIDGFGTQRYIVNLGHGMLPSHDPAKVKVLVDEVHRYSEELNKAAK